MAEIICPYCFEHFESTDVHFRAETVNPKSSIPSLDRCFVKKEDVQYEAFWKKYGETTESKDSVLVQAECPPNLRPVVSSEQVISEQGKTVGTIRELLWDEDGFVFGARDCYGTETRRRVCPHCHNPLPQNYGKYPITFLSVLGVRKAGKTVFLSQLCRYIEDIAINIGSTLDFKDKEVIAFEKKHVLAKGTPTPEPTVRGKLNQPLIFHFTAIRDRKRNKKQPSGESRKYTLVVYDIDGETLIDATDASRFAPMLKHSNALLLLLDPNQFADDTGRKFPPSTCLDVAWQLIQKGDSPLEVPTGVCLTKGDIEIPKLGLPVLSGSVYENSSIRFQANKHKVVSEKIEQFVRKNQRELYEKLYERFYCFNYFYCSSLGVNTKDTDDGPEPEDTPMPARMEEPLAWLFFKIGLTKSEGTEYKPEHQQRYNCPKCNQLTPYDGEEKIQQCNHCQKKSRIRNTDLI